MGRIRSKDTVIELIVRSLLHRSGYRFSLRSKGLPGNPDIVLTKYKAVVFVNGCFWHKHKAPECRISKIPKSNSTKWACKLERNVERDKANTSELERMGWMVFILWECEVIKDPAGSVSRLISWVTNGVHRLPHTVDVETVVALARNKHKLILKLKTGSTSFENMNHANP